MPRSWNCVVSNATSTATAPKTAGSRRAPKCAAGTHHIGRVNISATSRAGPSVQRLAEPDQEADTIRRDRRAHQRRLKARIGDHQIQDAPEHGQLVA